MAEPEMQESNLNSDLLNIFTNSGLESIAFTGQLLHKQGKPENAEPIPNRIEASVPSPELIPFDIEALAGSDGFAINPSDPYFGWYMFVASAPQDLSFLVCHVKNCHVSDLLVNAWNAEHDEFLYIKLAGRLIVIARFYQLKREVGEFLKNFYLGRFRDKLTQRLQEQKTAIQLPERLRTRLIDIQSETVQDALKDLRISQHNVKDEHDRKCYLFALTFSRRPEQAGYATAPIYVELYGQFLMIRVIFSYNRDYVKFSDNQREQYVAPFLSAVNNRIPLGVFAFVPGAENMVAYSLRLQTTLIESAEWGNLFKDSFRRTIKTYSEVAGWLAQIAYPANDELKTVEELIQGFVNKLPPDLAVNDVVVEELSSIPTTPETHETHETQDKPDSHQQGTDLLERIQQQSPTLVLRQPTDDSSVISSERFKEQLTAGRLGDVVFKKAIDYLVGLASSYGVWFAEFPFYHLLLCDESPSSPEFLLDREGLEKVISLRQPSGVYRRILTKSLYTAVIDAARLKFAVVASTDYFPIEDMQFPNLDERQLELGTGGYGVVYKNHWYGVDVAIKIPSVKKETRQRAITRILKEFQLMRAVSHPYIITVFGLVEWNGLPALVMELCPGEALNKLYGNNGSDTELSRKYRHILQTAAALEWMHLKGVAHFDLKPHNIFLGRDDSVRIGDFGMSKHVDRLHLKVKTGYTLMYCSPEQFEGNAQFSADVWSFGSTAYFILFNKSPFYHLLQPHEKITKEVYRKHVQAQKSQPILPEEFQERNPGLAYALFTTWVTEHSRPTMSELREFLLEDMGVSLSLVF